MFDLNNAIKHWRTALGAQPNFRASDLDELEDHLREEMTVLQTGGLNEEEAFLISSRRLGKPEDLNGEFAIADPERRRSFRLSWMITGALALALLWVVADVVTNFGAGALGRLPGEHIITRHPLGLGWIGGVIRLGALILGGAFIWRLLATDRTSNRLRSMSGGTVIALSLMLAFFALVARAGSEMFVSQGLTRDGFLNFAVTNAWINMVMMLVLPVVLLVGLWRLVKS